MSIKVLVYVPKLSKEVVPAIAARFAAAGMKLEFHPDFALDPEKDTGLVVARLCVLDSVLPKYKDEDMLTCFDISFKGFQYRSPLSVDPAVNEKLKACTTCATIRVHATPTSAVRTGLYFAAFFADVSDGIVYTPRSDKYLKPKQALEQLREEITTYEVDLPEQDWNLVPFSSWPL